MADLIDKVVPTDSPVVEHRIQDSDILEQRVVAVIRRDEILVVPRGETEICGGDEIVFMGRMRTSRRCTAT